MLKKSYGRLFLRGGRGEVCGSLSRTGPKHLIYPSINYNSYKSHARQKEGVQGKEDQRQGGRKRNSDVRRRRSFLVRDVGCDGQEKRWTVVWGVTSQGQRGQGLVLPSHNRNWENRKMNEVGRVNSVLHTKKSNPDSCQVDQNRLNLPFSD